MPVRAVLFDLDDTLIDHSYATLAATRAAIALEPALSAATFDEVAGSIEPSSWRPCTCAYLSTERAVPGAQALLEYLEVHGIAMAVVSNNTRAEQEAKLHRSGCFPYFSEIVVSGDHQIAKPDPALFTIALRKLGITAKDCVHIGDSWDSDVCGAAAAGIRPVWLNRFKRVRGGAPDAAEICAFDDLDAVVAALLEPTGRR